MRSLGILLLLLACSPVLAAPKAGRPQVLDRLTIAASRAGPLWRTVPAEGIDIAGGRVRFVPADRKLEVFDGEVVVARLPRLPAVVTLDRKLGGRKAKYGVEVRGAGDGYEVSSRFGTVFNNDVLSTVDRTGTTSVTPYLYTVQHPITQDVQYFQVDRSCSLTLSDWHAQTLLFSSPESFSDANASGTWDQGEFVGSFAVLAKAEHGKGRVVFIGDAVMFERKGRDDKALLDRIFLWLSRRI